MNNSQKNNGDNEIENGNKKEEDYYKKLAERLERELAAKKIFGKIDMRSQKDIQAKPPDILELEKEINGLREKPLPQQNLAPKKEEQDINQEIKLPAESEEILEWEYKKELDKEREKDKKLQKQRQREEKMRLKKFERLKKMEEKKRRKKASPQLNFGWYVEIIKRPVVYLAGIEFLIYFFSLISFTRSFLLNIILPLIVFLDAAVFAWIAVKVVRYLHYPQGIAIKACLLAGAFIGLFRAVFKIIWINKLWTILNIAIEPVILGGIAVISGFLATLFIKNRGYANKNIEIS